MNTKKWSDEELKMAVESSKSLRQTMLKLGLCGRGGGSYDHIRKHIQRLNISTEHFLGQSWLLGNRQDWRKKPLSHYLRQGIVNYGMLKKRIIEEKALPYVCSKCGLEPFWENKPLVLQLEHKNGNRTDNRLENLCFLCPNCHSQTETFCGRKLCKKRKERLVLNEKTGKMYFPRTGSRGPRPWLRKVTRPTAEELSKMIKTMSWCSIAKQYGVSDNAVRKWARSYGLLI